MYSANSELILLIKLGVRKGIRPVKRLAPIFPMYSYIHLITIPGSAKRVNA